jgi:stage II sporulation protein D
MRRSATALACAFAAAAGAGSASATTMLVVHGRGWGHGVGLSQWGAKGYADRGWTWQRILAHYYPGTKLAGAPLSRVRVLLGTAQTEAAVACAGTIKVNDASGAGWRLPPGEYVVRKGLRLPVGHKRVRMSPALRRSSPFRVVTVKRALRSPVVFDCPSAPLTWNGRAYHGALVVRRTGTRLSVVNSLRLDDYVRGVVAGEMPDRWRIAALAAQAVAARSYALATLKPGRHFDLYSDTRSQVYGGIAYETPQTNEAVSRTAGRVLTWNGHVASTYFFSTSGGRTADVREVWPGGADMPYLRSVADPYDVQSPHHRWGPIVLTERRIATLLKAKVADVTLERTASGRVKTIVLGGKRVDANRFRRLFGLESTWFDVGELSLTASRGQVVFGRKLELLARTRHTGPTKLQRRVGGSWKTVKTVYTGVRVDVQPRGRTLYRLSLGKVRGPVVTVEVAPRLRVAPTTTTLLSGTVAPRSRGTIMVWRQVAGGWRVVARPRLDAGGAFRAPVRLHAGGYRITVSADARFAAATTNVRVTHRLLASLQH